MPSFLQEALSRIEGSGLARLGIDSPFGIPSGIVTTQASVIARIARDVPHIGFLVTKTISLEPREGYREPVLYEYLPGSFVNAVGLANPGAAAFRAAMEPLLPLPGNKPLIVSIMGSDPAEFLECARILEPIADAFELNLSCPHVKAAGQAVGSDPERVRSIIELLKQERTRPVIPKLSPNLGNVAEMARLCEEAGADALTMINTVGPGEASDEDGNPVLSNIVGGLSGASILPLGLRCVREAASAVATPVIACGGISAPEHVKAYLKAGAALFTVGSALARMTTDQIGRFFEGLKGALENGGDWPPPVVCTRRPARVGFTKARVIEKSPLGPDMFKLTLDTPSSCKPGEFFFLRLPGTGEKPFSPAWNDPLSFIVRKVGPFTSALQELTPGDPIFLRGPYGKGFPDPGSDASILLVGGGAGTAPLMFAAGMWRESVTAAFFGFSQEIGPEFMDELETVAPSAIVAIDDEGGPGEVIRVMEQKLISDSISLERCSAYICGPAPMMRSAIQLLERIPDVDRILTAREDLMRCGIGICGSCGTPSGLRSCVDGPVMPPEPEGM